MHFWVSFVPIKQAPCLYVPSSLQVFTQGQLSAAGTLPSVLRLCWTLVKPFFGGIGADLVTSMGMIIHPKTG